MHETESSPDETPAPLATLLENQRAFLRYLERRVGDRELAEDILQDAFTKVVDRPAQAPADEGVVPWFYRTLRAAPISTLIMSASARTFGSFSRSGFTAEPAETSSAMTSS
jgi:RNA polymerase sigma-70 factor (ECF subfamily)